MIVSVIPKDLKTICDTGIGEYFRRNGNNRGYKEVTWNKWTYQRRNKTVSNSDTILVKVMFLMGV